MQRPRERVAPPPPSYRRLSFVIAAPLLSGTTPDEYLGGGDSIPEEEPDSPPPPAPSTARPSFAQARASEQVRAAARSVANRLQAMEAMVARVLSGEGKQGQSSKSKENNYEPPKLDTSNERLSKRELADIRKLWTDHLCLEGDKTRARVEDVHELFIESMHYPPASVRDCLFSVRHRSSMSLDEFTEVIRYLRARLRLAKRRGSLLIE